MVESFRRVDEAYSADRAARLQFMANSVFQAHGLDMSYVQDERDAESTDLLVVMSPLNDGKPETSPEALAEFVTLDHQPTFADIQRARPNSWSPATKLDVDYEFGHAEGIGIPRLQIFSRELPALTAAERRKVADGDTTPFGRLAELGIEAASTRKHQLYGNGGYKRIHLFCAGMGPKALGAAVHLLQTTDYEVGSVTAMNLAIGQESTAKLVHDYAGRRTVGEAAQLILPPNYQKVAEPLMRREIDGHGAELAMRARQVRAMLLNPLAQRGIMHSKQSPRDIEELLGKGVTVTVANAFNEAMVERTASYLPEGDPNFHYTAIVGVDGKKVGQIANEHSALVAVVSNLGLRNYLQRRAA